MTFIRVMRLFDIERLHFFSYNVVEMFCHKKARWICLVGYSGCIPTNGRGHKAYFLSSRATWSV